MTPIFPGTAPDLTGLSILEGAGAPSLLREQPAYDDDKKLLALAKRAKDECFDCRYAYERLWWRNILYVLGRQWIYYDRRTGQWRDKRIAKWIPRPTTDLPAASVEAILSLFGSINLQATARPTSHDSKALATAEIADQLEPLLRVDHRMESVFRAHDWWLIVAGNAFLHPYWDRDAAGGEIVIPWERCVMCGLVSPPSNIKDAGDSCPQCGSRQFLNATDAANQPIGDIVRPGRGRTDACGPLEIAIPHIYTTLDDSPYLIRQRFRSKRYAEDYLPHLVKKIHFSRAPQERSLQMMRAIATQAEQQALTSEQGFAGGGGATAPEGFTEYELHMRPTREWPEGLFFRWTDDLILRPEGSERAGPQPGGNAPGPLPYQTQDNRPIFNWIHTRYTPVEGRVWGRSPLDLALSKIDQINRLDSLTELSINRMSNPIWLKPKGAEIRSFTGEPGLVVEYNPLAAGSKPERIEGSNVPATVFQMRQQHVNDFEQMMGTYDVIKGAKPTGVAAFSALQLLVERSQSRFTTVFNARGETYRAWVSLALELERSFGPDERTHAVTKPNRGWTLQHFERAQLQGAIELVVEDGSQAPKTNLGVRASIEQARQLGILNPADPEQQYVIFREFGLTNLVPSIDAQIKGALNEQDAFETWAGEALQQPEVMQVLEQAAAQYLQAQQQYAMLQQRMGTLSAMGMAFPMVPPPTPPVMTPLQVKPYHVAQVHLSEHMRWALTDQMQRLFQAAPVLEQYVNWHIEETQQQLMAMQAPPPEAPGRGGALERSNNESGNPDDVPSGTGEGWQNQGPQ